MSKRIDTAVRRLRQDLSPHLHETAVHDLCKQLGYRWRCDALLTPFTIILWFVIQVLHGNTSLTHITLKARRKEEKGDMLVMTSVDNQHVPVSPSITSMSLFPPVPVSPGPRSGALRRARRDGERRRIAGGGDDRVARGKPR